VHTTDENLILYVRDVAHRMNEDQESNRNKTKMLCILHFSKSSSNIE